MKAALESLRRGGFVVLAQDDPDGLGELIAAASTLSDEAARRMATRGGGIIYVDLPRTRCRELQLDPQNPDGDPSRWQTDMLVAVDAAEGVTTGISAADRATTVRVLGDPRSGPSSLARSGHIVPLAAEDGGVWARADLAEAAVDLMMLAGLPRAAADCELLDDGARLRGADVRRFAERHDIPYVTVSDVVRHRARSEQIVSRSEQRTVDTAHGPATLHCFDDLVSDSRRYLLEIGAPRRGSATSVALLSACALSPLRLASCRCAESAEEAMRVLAEADHGILICTVDPGRACPTGDSGQGESRTSQLESAAQAQMLQSCGVERVTLVPAPVAAPAALAEFGIAVLDADG